MVRYFIWGLGILAAAGMAILAITLLWPGTPNSRESILQTGIDRGGSKAMTTFSLTSPAFTKGGAILAKYTCDGDDISPPLSWNGVPENAQSLALIMDDPDAPDPDAPQGDMGPLGSLQHPNVGCSPIGGCNGGSVAAGY